MYKFAPILKTLVWGTESWVLSGVPGYESVVAEGPEAGKKITEIWPGEFPLLVKFLDTRRDLSIQVHPDDAMAARYHGCPGKTEMWFFMGAEVGAYVYCGLKEEITPEDYVRLVAEDRITEVLARHDVAPGDVFFLPPGRIHAIGGGCRLAEIQQTSDITYRIYDYNRPGLDGKPRPLHTELAREAIDYTVYPDYRTHYVPQPNVPVELIRCPYFTTDLLELTPPSESSRRADGNYFSDKFVEKPISAPLSDGDVTVTSFAGLTGESPTCHSVLSARHSEPSTCHFERSREIPFIILIGLSGSGKVRTEADETTLQAGEAILVPAAEGAVSLLPGPAGLKLLTTHP